MKKVSKQEYFKAIYERYQQTKRKEKRKILDEFCKICGYNRKYAIRKLNRSEVDSKDSSRRRKRFRYSEKAIGILWRLWESCGYLCSVRLKAVVRLWLPWIRSKWKLTAQQEQEILTISARQLDRRFRERKRQKRKKMYGRTKPGTLLKHQIPIRAGSWNTSLPGFTEIDLVSHSGDSAAGQFIYSLNQTDIQTTWVETRAVMGKAEDKIIAALEELAAALPFQLLGVDSDNGSEFINHHLFRYCKERNIEFTRSRPFKKDDNAHIEQKNWTHVRKLIGWDRYDTTEAAEAMNDLYRNELRLFLNVFVPSMKLIRKVQVGSKIKKIYDSPRTPLDRALESKKAERRKIAHLLQLRAKTDPFELTKTIEKKLERIYAQANHARKTTKRSNRGKFPNLFFGSMERERRAVLQSL